MKEQKTEKAEEQQHNKTMIVTEQQLMLSVMNNLSAQLAEVKQMLEELKSLASE